MADVLNEINNDMKQEDISHDEEKNEAKKKESYNGSSEEDEEGLLVSGYDAVICGTGLVHSILASALSLAGKSVLHCDGGDFYGEADGSMDLIGILEWAEATANWQKNGHSQQSSSEMSTVDNDNYARDSMKLKLNQNGSWSGIHVHSYSSNTLNENGTHNDQNLGQNTKDTRVRTPYGRGSVLKNGSSSANQYTNAISISLDQWTLADGSHPILYVHPDSPIHPIDSCLEIDHVKDSLLQSRKFILDFTTQGPLLLANDKAVSGLISSNVAEYVEFKSVQSIDILLPANNDNSPATITSSTSASTNTEIDNSITNSPLLLCPVPCSKGDVFQTDLLSPMEKRKLMKLLQLISDYEISQKQQQLYNEQQKEEEEEEKKNNITEKKLDKDDNNAKEENQAIKSLNERKLNQGRSLSRPQNKSISTSSLQELKSIMNHDNNKDGKPILFHNYLKNNLKLSPTLTNLIMYSLAMQTISTENLNQCATAKQGILALCMHLNSLGRYGKTAFLVPLYGSGELSQSFCRSSAVYGGVYLLRRCPSHILSMGSSSLGVQITGDTSDSTEVINKEKVVKCKHAIVSQAALYSSSTAHNNKPLESKTRTLKRISIIHGLFPNRETQDHEADGQSTIIIIPPLTPNIGNMNCIQGVILDHSSCVAPPKYTVLHLSTIIDADIHEVDDKVLDRCIDSILLSANRMLDEGDPKLEEVHHVCYSILQRTTRDYDTPIKLSNNIHVSSFPRQSLTIEHAFEEAERIFSSICNQEEDKEKHEQLKFLKICTELKKLREQRNGYGELHEDDEKVVLESALNMIESEDLNNDTHDKI